MSNKVYLFLEDSDLIIMNLFNVDITITIKIIYRKKQ